MNVDVTRRGEIPPEAAQRSRERIEALDRQLPDRIVRAHVVLRREANPRIERPARAECELDLNGPVVRAHVADLDFERAIEAMARHLERQLRRFEDQRLARQRRPTSSDDGEWRHGDWTPPRPDHFPLPPAERRIVRRKTFAIEPMTPEDAVLDLEALDHSFYLFRDLETDLDAVVYHRDDGRIGAIGPAEKGWLDGPDDGPVREESRTTEPTALEDAVAEMNALDHRFMYFTDAGTGRGNVIYLRYDGNYGLIVPR